MKRFIEALSNLTRPCFSYQSQSIIQNFIGYTVVLTLEDPKNIQHFGGGGASAPSAPPAYAPGNRPTNTQTGPITIHYRETRDVNMQIVFRRNRTNVVICCCRRPYHKCVQRDLFKIWTDFDRRRDDRRSCSDCCVYAVTSCRCLCLYSVQVSTVIVLLLTENML